MSRFFPTSFRKAILYNSCGLLSLLLIVTSSVTAQSAGEQSPSNETIKQLTDRLTAAEAKIQELEAQVAKQAGGAPALAVVPTPAAAVAQPPPQEPWPAPEPAPA